MFDVACKKNICKFQIKLELTEFFSFYRSNFSHVLVVYVNNDICRERINKRFFPVFLIFDIFQILLHFSHQYGNILKEENEL
jgi:hypothetical protein